MLAQLLTPLNAFFMAFVSACGVALMKRRWTVADRRERRDDKCERYEVAYRILMFWARQENQVVIAINALRATQGDAYVLGRVAELAQAKTPFDELMKFIETGAELSAESEKLAE